MYIQTCATAVWDSYGDRDYQKGFDLSCLFLLSDIKILTKLIAILGLL